MACGGVGRPVGAGHYVWHLESLQRNGWPEQIRLSVVFSASVLAVIREHVGLGCVAPSCRGSGGDAVSGFVIHRCASHGLTSIKSW